MDNIYEIGGERYTYLAAYQENAELRKSFNRLTQLSFEFDFEEWYRGGYWGSKYTPYSLLFEGEVVANVSVNVMNFELAGVSRLYIQIGTVMTHPDYRGRGLSRFLMERVMEIWGKRCDLVMLYANEEVLGFYPKFGFESCAEYRPERRMYSREPSLTLEKVDIGSKESRERLEQSVLNSRSFAQLNHSNSLGIAMFYCTGPFSESVYYVKGCDAYIVAEIEPKRLYLQALFCEQELDLEQFLTSLAPVTTERIELGFTPFEMEGYYAAPFINDDTTLFIQGDDKERIRRFGGMFPLLAHT